MVRERERKDFIAGINGNNINRFRFRQLSSLKGIVFHHPGKGFCVVSIPF